MKNLPKFSRRSKLICSWPASTFHIENQLRGISAKREIILLFFILLSFMRISILDAIAESESLDEIETAVINDISDPFEDVNRKIFWFNDKLDIYAIEPISHVYHDALPEKVRTAVSNFFQNLRYPIFLVSDIFQFKLEQAGNHTARFAINSTIGVVGLFDFASDWGFERHDEDFGTTLAYYGVSNGPYLVLPILGPSSLRDAFGQVVNISLDPIWHIFDLDISPRIANSIVPTLAGVRILNIRESSLEVIDALKPSSLDFYSMVRASYHKSRDKLVNDVINYETEEYGRLIP
ncbi:MAG TPA: VacJ family lipoprotein [Oligoflexia bacterium]|nr:VacJ family lipoprotein [Oligoflexia bacterium]HMP49525.1 VacJ family lipoprotein [Oligoflexia bacterium]